MSQQHLNVSLVPLAFSGLPDIFRVFDASRRIMDDLPRFFKQIWVYAVVELNDSFAVARGEILAAGFEMLWRSFLPAFVKMDLIPTSGQDRQSDTQPAT